MSGFLTAIFRPFRSRRSDRYIAIEGELRDREYSRSRLKRLIGFSPRDEELFLEALIHRSFLPFIPDSWNSNERLEFLGDAVLNMVVADHLYEALPDHEEGHLTKLRARLVNRRILAEKGREMGLQEMLLMSSSAAQSLEQGSESMIADAYEAVIGAVYIDAGMDEARRFIDRTLLADVDIRRLASTDDNHKSILLELAQSKGKGMPRYEIVREDGPEHEREFTVEVRVGNSVMGSGVGKSKKAAEQAAAQAALRRLGRR